MGEGDCMRRNQDVAWRNIAGQVVLIDPRESVLQSFNPVASRIWELADGTRDLKQVADQICQEFEVEREEAERDVGEFVAELKACGLLEGS